MLNPHFKIACRNLWKQKGYSLINILGLATGLAACWTILLHIGNELKYDRFHDNAQRIYRVAHQASWPDGKFNIVPTSAPFAGALQNDYTEIEKTVRIDAEGGGFLTTPSGTEKIQEGNIFVTDSSFLDIFSFPLLAGDKKTALSSPNSIVLSQTLAQKLFGNVANAMGKTVIFDGVQSNIVTGVIADVPTASHMQFKALRSFSGEPEGGWQNFSLYTYVLLQKGADIDKLEQKLPAFYEKHLKSQMGQLDYKLLLQPLTSIHLHSHLDYELGANGDIRHIYLFSTVAILVLLIACINYVNLSTARSSVRFREVGIRKTIGAGQAQVAALFLAESVILTMLSAVIALLMVLGLLPYFNQLAGTQLQAWQFGVWPSTGILLAFSLIAGLLAGIYPAFFMSRFHVLTALKGKFNNVNGSTQFRRVLVGFQFVTAIVLMAGSFVTYKQMRFVLNKDLGFNKDQVLTFHIDDQELRKHIPALKEQLLRSPLILQAAAAGNPIGNNNIGTKGYQFEQDNGVMKESSLSAQNFMVDGDFINTMEIKLVAGRNVSDSIAGDKFSSVLVNETLVKEMGWKDPIGKRLTFPISATETAERRVAGVVKDFHIYSLQHKIAPLVLEMPPFDKDKDNLYVKVGKQDVPAALTYIRQVFRQFDREHEPAFSFLDQNFAAQYRAEEQQSLLIIIFTLLAVVIACLGLFGLTAFSTRQRTREIGIRRVLGASLSGIVRMLSFDFFKLIVIAALVAFPLAWWGMHKWLQDFAYSIPVQWWVLLLATLSVMVIALCTVSYHAVKAGLANPVKALQAE